MDIPVYNMVFDEDDKGGLFGISLVDKPANRMDFITLSEGILKLRTENEEKQIVSGVVLIPEQLIYRNDPTFGEHFITFHADTIESLCYSFLASDKTTNSWYNHNPKDKLNPVIVESWIISDPSNDKSVALGFKDLPKGTWMVSMKLSDKEWDSYVKTGKVKGFSIDAYLGRELKLKKENKMESVMKKLITMLKNHTKVKLATIEVEGEVLESEGFEKGNVVTKDGEPYANQKFDYMGYTYTTDDAGVITSVVQIEEDIVEVEAVEDEDEEIKEAVEDVVEDAGVDADTIPIESIIEVVKEIIEEEPELDEYLRNHYSLSENMRLKYEKLFSKEKESFNTTITKLNKKIVELTKELETVPASTKLSANAVNVPKHKETEIDAIERIVQMGRVK